jgi:hypothetical protein
MFNKLSCLVAVVAIAALSQSAQATTAFITFDDLPQGPSLFGAAPQTIIYPQATFTDGVILGNPTNFPQGSFATSPNVYGTCSCVSSMLADLTTTIDPSFPTSEVSFPLFNGLTTSQSYTVAAYDSSNNLLTSLNFPNIPSNQTSNGYAIVDLTAAGIGERRNHPGWLTEHLGLSYRLNRTE